MIKYFPLEFTLSDGTYVKVFREDEDCFEFYLTRLNSEKHNFFLTGGQIEESYETRFDELQKEAVSIFESMKKGNSISGLQE